MSGISQGLGDVRSRPRQGIPGMRAYNSRHNRAGFGVNANPQAVQVSTVTVDAATNDKIYTITVNGVPVSFLSDGAATQAKVAAGLKTAVDEEPLVRGRVIPTVAGAVVTLTGKTPGEVFTLTEADAELTAALVTAADEADPVPFGRAVVQTGRASDTDPQAGPERLVALAATSLFSPQVLTFTSTFVSGAVIKVSVYEVRGGERTFIRSAFFASATNLDTTLDGLIAALEAAMPANTVAFTPDNASATEIIATAEIPGFEFDLDIEHVSGGASVPAFTKTLTTGPNPTTSLNRGFAGVSTYSRSDEAPVVGGGEGEYAANAGVKYDIASALWVESTETPSEGDTVYVELAAGATAGRLYAAGSATRVALERKRAVWERAGRVPTDNIALVRLGA